MEWYYSFTLLFGGFFVLLLARIPVAFAFFLINMITAFILWGQKGFIQVILNLQSSVGTFTLLPLPLFILLGDLLFSSGVATIAVTALSRVFGRVPGRLSLLVVVSGTLLGALSGSSAASTAVLSSTFYGHMKKLGYKDLMSVGPIIGAGGLAIMIPPSNLAIVYASLAYVSTGQLLIAIVVPGVLLGCLYAIYIIGVSILKPSLAPHEDVARFSIIEKIRMIVLKILPLGFIIFCVTGTIFIGFATPSEAAALGCLGACILLAVYRKLSWQTVKRSLINSTKINVMIFFIIVGAATFGQILAFARITDGFLGLANAFSSSPMLVIIMMQLFLVFLGCFLECASIMMISLPIFMPIVTALGVNPIWFGVLVLINSEMACITPPFGVNLFVMQALAKDVPLQRVYLSGVPFMVCDCVMMALLFVFPNLTLWLPSLMKPA